MAEGSVGVHPQSETDHQVVRANVIMLGSALAVSSLPSVGGVVLAGTATAFAFLNIRSGVPPMLAANAWRTLAGDLESERKRVLAEAHRIRGGQDDLWKGPGAEAFLTYVEKNLGPNIAEFKSICEAVDKELQKQGKTLGDAASKHNTDQLIFIGLNIAAKLLLLIPKVGPALHDAMVFANNIMNWVDVASDVQELWGDLSEAVTAEGAVSVQASRLGNLYGFEGERLRGKTGNLLRDAIPPVIGSSNTWGKA